MGPADSRRITRVPRYSGYHYAKSHFEYRTITFYGYSFQNILLDWLNTISWSYNPYGALLRHRFGLFPVRSPLLGKSLNYFLFLQVLRCFSSLRWLSYIARVTCLQHARLSHSEIFGSKIICIYPKLIAAYHVLHRLHEPRHPPCALSYFLRSTLIDSKIIPQKEYVAHTFSCCVISIKRNGILFLETIYYNNIITNSSYLQFIHCSNMSKIVKTTL